MNQIIIHTIIHHNNMKKINMLMNLRIFPIHITGLISQFDLKET